MAINPESQYPGKINAASAEYPYGSARNISVPGDGTGTPWEEVGLNDVFGLHQALLNAAGIAPSGSPDNILISQYLNAIAELIGGRAKIYDDSGAADAYVLANQANQGLIQSYFTGLEVQFLASAANTGASTVNINGIGVVNIFRSDGGALEANDISNTRLNLLRYNGVSFNIVNLENFTYDVSAFVIGEPQDTDNVVIFMAPRKLIINQTDTAYKTPLAQSAVATTINATMSITVDAVPRGTITFTGGSVAGVVAWLADFEISPGSVIVIEPPNVTPTGMRDLAITLPFIEG